MQTSRRSFLQVAAAGTVLGAAVPAVPAGPPSRQPRPGPEPDKAGRPLSLLFLGGTGFLGPATVEWALARGHTVTLFNRGKTNPDLFPDVEKLKGDRHEADSLDILKGRTWDAVIDTSAYVPAHVEASAGLLAANVGQYVLVSSVSVYADHGVPHADETAAVVELTDEVVATMKTIRESLAHYGGMKARCERAAETALPGRVTNIRPGLIVGPLDRSDRFTYWAVRVPRGGEVLAPGDGSDPVQLIDVRDLAEWIVHCIEYEITGVFNAISPAGRFTMAEMLYGIKGAFVTDARFTWVDAEFLESQGVNAWTHLPVWIPAVDEYAGFHLASTEKAVAAGLKFRPLADTARDTVTWHDESRPADYEFGGRLAGLSPQREAEILKAWHERAAGEKTGEPATATEG
ncbi:MAG: SDR family oxidoreductase [Planctomycetota bacterium]|jgi:2'-hydroxyisoflavone reductase